MTEETGGSEGTEERGAKEKVSDGIRQGIGVLSAFRDALEETIHEARERGDLSTDRAKQVMKTALERAQAAAGSARERLDFVTQHELDELKARVDELAARLDRLDGGAGDGDTASGDAGPAEGAEST